MLELWPCIEADFLREYHIDLLASLPALSWRRFLALLSGLTADSSFITALRTRRTSEPIADVKSIAAAVRSRRRR